MALKIGSQARVAGLESRPVMGVLVTGASGFVGRGIIETLRKHGQASLRAAVRRLPASPEPSAEYVLIPDIGPSTDFSAALDGIEVIVHAAGRAHVMHNDSDAALQAHRWVNTGGTLRLADQAAKAGIRRFIFLSSVKVNGEETQKGRPFTLEDEPAPSDAYAVSKHEAEVGLQNISASTGMEVVVIRPPLVYGPRVKANFQALMRLIGTGLPLPLAGVHNCRSFVALDNLADLVRVVVNHPAAANRTFFVSDGKDLSTTDLVKRLGRGMESRVRLFALPAGVVMAAAGLLGKRRQAIRLLGNLQVDISQTKQQLGWSPVVSADDALLETARHYTSSRR